MKMETNVFDFQYRLCLLKAFYDKGYNLTKPIILLIGLFGLSSNNIKNTMIMGVTYIIFAFILGWFWFRSKFVLAEAEVGNRYNLFQREVRNKIKKFK